MLNLIDELKPFLCWWECSLSTTLVGRQDGHSSPVRLKNLYSLVFTVQLYRVYNIVHSFSFPSFSFFPSTLIFHFFPSGPPTTVAVCIIYTPATVIKSKNTTTLEIFLLNESCSEIYMIHNLFWPYNTREGKTRTNYP